MKPTEKCRIPAKTALTKGNTISIMNINFRSGDEKKK